LGQRSFFYGVGFNIECGGKYSTVLVRSRDCSRIFSLRASVARRLADAAADSFFAGGGSTIHSYHQQHLLRLLGKETMGPMLPHEQHQLLQEQPLQMITTQAYANVTMIKHLVARMPVILLLKVHLLLGSHIMVITQLLTLILTLAVKGKLKVKLLKEDKDKDTPTLAIMFLFMLMLMFMLLLIHMCTPFHLQARIKIRWDIINIWLLHSSTWCTSIIRIVSIKFIVRVG
jgi:hypothetical protein